MAERTILIADDSLDNQAVLEAALGENYNVLTAEDGNQALDILRSSPSSFSAVILDLVMPGKDSYKVLYEMKSDSRLSEIPVIVVTPSGSTDNEIRALDLGAVDIIVKPFDARIIRQRLSNVIKSNENSKIRIENNVLKMQKQAQIQLQALLDNITGGVMLVEFCDEPHTLYINDGFYRMINVTKTRLSENPSFIQTGIDKEDIENVKIAAQCSVLTGTPFSSEFRIHTENKKEMWIHCQGVPIEYPDSEYPVLMVILMDITPLKNAEEEIQSSSRQLRTLVNSVPGGIAIFKLTDDKIKTVFFNESFPAFSGRNSFEYSEDLEDDATPAIFEADLPGVKKSVEKALETGEQIKCPLRIKRVNGGVNWVRLTATYIGDDNGSPMFYAVLIDINKEKEIEQKNVVANLQLQYRADHDLLTGIYNREAFCERTSKLIWDNLSEKYVVCCIDIDHFKVINDLFGVETGDSILMKIADLLRKMYGKVGTYARLETDHFAFCIPERLLDIDTFLNKASLAISGKGYDYTAHISLGIYQIDDVSLPVDRMCDRAILAVKSVKGNYIRKAAYYDEKLRNTLIDEQKILGEMNGALEEHQFVFYLQPICSLSQGKVISAEALVRWIRPNSGMVSPGVFIPLFERNGFIAKLDRYVWEEVCKYLKDRKERGLELIPISVNMSRLSMFNTKLADEFTELVSKYDIDPSLLKIEITESAYTDSAELLKSTMTSLQERGFTILMDDFGSGYSSLNMLKDVPVNILKIDMLFLGGFETSARAGSILTSVVRMAKWLSVPVIAEGVETKAQVEFLRSIGCDSIQGYYFSKPLPVKDFEAFSMPAEKQEDYTKQEVTQTDFDMLFNGNQMITKLFNSVIGGIGIYELNGERLEVIKVNDGYYDIMGYNPQTFFDDASSVFDRVDVRDRTALFNACLDAVKGSPSELVVRRMRTDGRLLYLKAAIRCIGGYGERPLICFAINDVSAQYNDKRIIEEQKERISNNSKLIYSIYSTVSCGIVNFKINDDGKFVFCNIAAAQIFGFDSSKEFLDYINSGYLRYIDDSDHASAADIVERFVMGENNISYKIKIITKDGNGKLVAGKLTRMSEDDGGKYAQCSFIDIT